MDTIEQIESQRNELVRQIASVGELRPGNLSPHSENVAIQNANAPPQVALCTMDGN